MQAIGISDASSTIPAAGCVSSFDAGRQRQGPLWSNLKEVCQLLQIPAPVCDDNDFLFQHVQFKKGQRIHAIGKTFHSLHIVSAGAVKTRLLNEFGNEQVLNFAMRGDMLGIDGIGTRRYVTEAIALSDCDLVLVPYKEIIALGRSHPELENTIACALSRELTREQAMNGMMRALRAEAKVARFLLAMADRFAAMGYLNQQLYFFMTRVEIGSYLGITVETVSRTLSLFNEVGFITLNKRSISIHDPDALRTLRRLAPTRPRNVQPYNAQRKTKANQPREVALFAEV